MLVLSACLLTYIGSNRKLFTSYSVCIVMIPNTLGRLNDDGLSTIFKFQLGPQKEFAADHGMRIHRHA